MANGKVTLNDIYAVVNRLEDKIDKRMCEVENRVDVLEEFRGRLLGMITIVSAFAGVISHWIWGKLTNS